MLYLSTSQSNGKISPLICPVCGASLSIVEGKSLYCRGEKRHCFDVSSKGHVNLAIGHAGGGDPKEAVRARSEFLRKGYYGRFADGVCDLLSKYVAADAETVIDAGCGEGYYSERIAESCSVNVVGFDLSKAAIESAAARAKREGREDLMFAVAGIYSMPIADGCADGVVNLFAPCAEDEFLRVLKKGGVLLVAGAGEDHLYGLKERLYETPYKNEKRNDMPQKMKHLEHITVRFELVLTEESDKQALFSMTPYYYRTSKEDASKLFGAPLTTEAEFDIDIYIKE